VHNIKNKQKVWFCSGDALAVLRSAEIAKMHQNAAAPFGMALDMVFSSHIPERDESGYDSFWKPNERRKFPPLRQEEKSARLQAVLKDSAVVA
jgi:hypothetical protein